MMIGFLLLASAPLMHPLEFADPHVIYQDGVYYAYGTGNGTFEGADGIPVATSTNLVDWVIQPEMALKKGPGVYGHNHFWAPEVYKFGNRFFMCYTANEGEDDGKFNGTCLAVSDAPLGPFKSVPNCPLITECGSIDNTIFVDDDGKKYMFFAYYITGPGVWMAEMSDDGMSVKYDTAKCVIKSTEPWEIPTDTPARVCEGPFVVKVGKTYYLTYSCFPTQHQGYRVCLATADSIHGPWVKRGGKPILSARDGLFGTAHHSFFKDGAGKWKIAFHAHASNTAPFPRRMFIADADFVELNGEPWIEIGTPVACRVRKSFDNPVINCDWPDPTIWRDGDGLYRSVATELKTLMVSRDLVHWSDTGKSPITEAARMTLTNITRNVWAPCVKKIGDKWVMYISLLLDDRDCRIMTLTSDKADGPFEYHGTLIDGLKIKIMNAIDPFVIENERNVWLFFGSCQDGVHVVELASDGLSVKSGAEFKHVAGLRFDPEKRMWGLKGTYEGTYVMHHGDWWYMFISGGMFNDHTYHLMVGRSRELTGPYFDQNGRNLTEGKAEPILLSDKGERFFGPGHNGEVFTDAVGNTWMFFHAHDQQYKDGKPRPTLLQQLQWSDDGWPYFENSRAQLHVGE